MSTSGFATKRFIWLSLTALLAIIAFAIFKPANQEAKKPLTDTTAVYLPQPKKEVIPEPVQTIILADSTNVLLLHKEATVQPAAGYPQPREIKVDGEMYFEIKDSAKPTIIRSRLLVLTVVGKAAFRVIAWAKEAGEEVQVLSGNIRVRPNYESQFNTPDTLHGNQMVMINKSIDMMEKEKFDATELKIWSEKIRRP
jgi:hypothetical protein